MCKITHLCDSALVNFSVPESYVAGVWGRECRGPSFYWHGDKTMRLFKTMSLAILLGLTAVQAASAYEIDPVTRMPLVMADDGRIRATPIPREEVEYKGRFAPGTVVVDTNEKRLYLVLANGRAMKYGVGVGRPGFSWSGTKNVTRKAEWPSWTPPAQMLRRRPDLPRFMPGGEGNPMGARALYLGTSLYRIHGSNEPETIGQAVSSGCIRMLNEDVIDLYERVRVGTRVVVMR
jgi:lipoprotein-anchoring transpeptidase ErfK/SrfK